MSLRETLVYFLANLGRVAWLGLAVLLGACQSAPVDFAPTKPIDYAHTKAWGTPTNGSLFQARGYRPGFEDPRARWPGDTLTIQITEKVSANQSSSSNLDRSGSVGGSVTAVPLIKPADLAKVNNLTLGADSSNTFAGSGDNANANDFSGVITVTVQDVMPNGHLLVAGDKQIGVNNNVDVLRFSGTVDPRHIKPGNTVASTQVANARIESRGRGPVDQALSIGWLSRAFLSVFPF
jgi:flagellar L-ring protein precursor FlgH